MKPKILIVGGLGFLGQYLAANLIKLGYNLRVIDKVPTYQNKKELNCEIMNLDICDPTNAKVAFRNIDICITLAALSGGVRFYNEYPASIFSKNNAINQAVFEGAARAGIERIVYISSSAVFDKCHQFPIVETDLSNLVLPSSGYSLSKLVGEMYCKLFFEEFKLRYSIVRPFNIYGVGQKLHSIPGYSHVITDLTEKILKGQYPLQIFGDGQQTRCFTHVSDIVSGIIKIVESEAAINEDFNLSANRETSILELAQVLWKLCGRTETIALAHKPSFQHDVTRQLAYSNKAKHVLGWEAKIDLVEGLKQIVEDSRLQYIAAPSIRVELS